jgi:type I restriction enzyme S subunit
MTPALPAIDIQPQQWVIVQSILKKYIPQYEVLVFGSRAKNKAKPYSDLDLAIITTSPLPLQVRANLADAFSESDLPWKVDIVDWSLTSENFKQIILREKISLGKPGI